MIERAYMAVCDSCLTEAEAITPRHVTRGEYVAMIRDQGWINRRGRKDEGTPTVTLCPNCAKEQA